MFTLIGLGVVVLCIAYLFRGKLKGLFVKEESKFIITTPAVTSVPVVTPTVTSAQ